MPPTLVLIRHAQAVHNTDRAYHSMLDPPLTALGEQQAAELREHLKAHLPADRKVSLILVSPMRRALQTCLIALDWLIDAGVPVVPDARWQELHPKPCDTGTPAALLAPQFPTIDFTSLDPVYPDKTTPAGAQYAFTRSAVLARGQAVLRELRARDDLDVVVVVSHSGFLRSAVAPGRFFENADWRVFDFESGGGGADAAAGEVGLVEWEVSQGKGGMGRSREDGPHGVNWPEEGGK